MEPFNRLGDSFLAVSPWDMIMFTADAEVISQIMARRDHFPKPTRRYAMLEVFGRNVVTTEGAEWRVHRKATSAGFNERNAAYTFAESINQAHGMIQKWLGPDGKGHRTIKSVEEDTMTLALNVISYVGFGFKMMWPGIPGQKPPGDADPEMKNYGSLDVPKGHTMSFPAALAQTLEKILILMLIPGPLLSTPRLPPTSSARQSRPALTAR
jgi:hypothetical protein